jgi:trimeric autotransporter adhesin
MYVSRSGTTLRQKNYLAPLSSLNLVSPTISSPTLSGSVTGDLIPVSDNVYDLGSASYKWNDVYATTFTGALTGNASTATAALGLKTATTTVAISSATAPSANQVLVASSSTAAAWASTLAGLTLTSPTITGSGSIAGTFTGNLTGDVTGNSSTVTGLRIQGTPTTPTASGTRAIALGSAASATTGTDGTAIGANTVVTGTGAVAIGSSATASQGASASGGAGIAIGGTAGNAGDTGAIASGLNSLAIGGGGSGFDGALASSSYSIAIGPAAVASTGDAAIAMGSTASATAAAAIAIGQGAVASTGSYALAVGPSASASAADATAIGRSISNTVANSTVIGNAGSESLRLNNPAVGGVCSRRVSATSASATPTLTAAMAVGGLVTLSNAGAITVTTDTGTNLDSAFAGVYTGMSFDCWLVSTDGTPRAITVSAGASGITVYTNAVTTRSVAYLSFVRTGTNTWICNVV